MTLRASLRLLVRARRAYRGGRWKPAVRGAALLGLGFVLGAWARGGVSVVAPLAASAAPVAAPAAALPPAAARPDVATMRAEIRERYEALRRREREAAVMADRSLAGVPSIVPVVDARLTSSYTSRRLHPVLRRVKAHWGVDLAARSGEQVRSTADGEVLYVVRNRTYGLMIDVRHGERFITRYGHLSAVHVRAGDVVGRGQTIGRVGSSGLSTGPHLHYEVFVDGRRRDPIYFLELAGDQGLLP